MAEVIDVTISIPGNHKLLFAVQVFEPAESDSLTEVTARFPWSALTVYDANMTGRNHGQLFAT